MERMPTADEGYHMLQALRAANYVALNCLLESDSSASRDDWLRANNFNPDAVVLDAMALSEAPSSD